MRWLEISVQASHEAVDAVSALFHEHGHGGVAIADEPAANGACMNARVSTYLPMTRGWKGRLSRLERAFWHLTAFNLAPISELSTREVDEEDWANAWKEFFPVTRIGRRIVVKPSWRDYSPLPQDVVLELDPGQVFGTGQHPSTALCLEALEDLPLPGASVLDMGTGSGILALAAAGLGASRVLALDIDPVAVAAARENARRSPWEDAIEVRDEPLGSVVERGERFSVCVANLIASLIVDLASQLHAALAPGGALVAGGILALRAEEVKGALADAGFRDLELRERESWAVITGVSGLWSLVSGPGFERQSSVLPPDVKD